jgi:hypothetical protein
MTERYKRGYVREDGMVFWSYNHNSKNRQRWVTAKNYLLKKEHDRIACQQWRKSNREKENSRIKRWKNKNLSKVLANNSRRRAKEISSILMLHSDQEGIIKTIYEASSRISECIGIKHHVDHVIPISRGGYHIHTNLQILPAKINLKKSSKLFVD